MREGAMDSEPIATAAATPGPIDQALAQALIMPGHEGYAVARRGLGTLLDALVASHERAPRIDKHAIDALIADIDRRLSAQLDEILHHADLQRLESAWRGVKLLVDRTEFGENIRVHLLDIDQESLRADFDEAPEICQSGLYKLVYTGEFGQFGGEPYAAMIADYHFGPSPRDVALLAQLGSVAAMAHAPFIAAAAPSFFGLEDYRRLPNLNDLASIIAGPGYERWRSFRDSDDARNVGLTLPRFLLRAPYVPGEVRSFAYEESASGDHRAYLWGNAAFAFATRLTESFARYRWCPNIIGPSSGGSVANLPLHHFQSSGGIATRIPTEALISERCEFELAEQGFITLAVRKGADDACFFSANSCQRPKGFGGSPEGRQAEVNHRLGTQLPYLLIVNRLAHYIKVLQREQIGSWKERADLERELNAWLGQYVADMDTPQPSVRDVRPLRAARVAVEDPRGEPGWYRVRLSVRPHFKYMGAAFTLSLVGRLDKDGA
jgi:type VI secretion system protein ImpC